MGTKNIQSLTQFCQNANASVVTSNRQEISADKVVDFDEDMRNAGVMIEDHNGRSEPWDVKFAAVWREDRDAGINLACTWAKRYGDLIKLADD